MHRSPARRRAGRRRPSGDDGAEGALHRRLAVDANNSTWELLERWSTLTPDEGDDLLGRAYAAAHHWRRASGADVTNAVRASWLVSRAHAVLGQGEAARHHAERCVDQATAAGLDDFDLAYALEARARALACLGHHDEAAAALAAARAVPVADPEDAAILAADIAAEPWFGLAAPDLTHPSVGRIGVWRWRGPPARNTPMDPAVP